MGERFINCLGAAAVLSLALGSLGCSGAADVPPTQLSGQWGGENIELHDSAAAHALVMDVPCETALFPEPVTLDNAGDFTARGVIIQDSWQPMVGLVEDIAGSVVGRKLNLTMTLESPLAQPPAAAPWPFTLFRSRPRLWGYYECSE